VLGVFFAGRFFSNTIMGYASDRIGRKWLLVLSLAVSTVCIGVFTYLPALWLVIVIRTAHGLFGATPSLAKGYIVDITSNNNTPISLRSLLFAYLGSTFTISRAAAAALGGILVGVCQIYGVRHPYMIPCILSAVIVGVGFIVSIVLPESLQKGEEEVAVQKQKGFFSSCVTILGDSTRIKLLTIFMIINVCNSSCFLVWVLVAQEHLSHGGFAFGSLQTGIIFLVYGCIAVLFYIILLKPVINRLGLLTCFKVGSFFQLLQNLMMVVLVLVNKALIDTQPRLFILWGLIVIFCVLTTVGFMMTSNVIQSMIVNATPKIYQGLAHGISESVNTASRAIGPIVFGFIFSYLVYKLGSVLPIFGFFIVLYGIGAIISYTLNKEDVDP
jgi:MFS family permease